MSRPTPRVPDPALLGPRPFGDPGLARILRSAPLCAAVSGGADSVALLHALVRLRAWLGAKPPYGLVAAHFHHGIRGAEADADAAFVEELCASLGVPLRTGRGDVPAEAARTGESIEMAARRLRHAFLRDVCGDRPIATGHTLDDQAELFFLRLKRGASARGLAGMRPFEAAAGSAPARVRPLLRARHATLVDFLRAEGLAWREDATNDADDADRNRIRHRVVPAVLDAFGPSFLSTLARSMDLLRDDSDLLDDLARTESAASPRPGSRKRPPAAPSLLRRRIAAALYAAGADPETVTLDAIERVRGLLEAHRGGAIPLGDGVAARVKRGAIVLERAAAGDCKAEVGCGMLRRMTDTPSHEPAFAAIVADAARAVASLERIGPAFEKAAALVVGALRAGRKVLAAGNGGSAAEAMHLAEELSGRYHADRRALPGLALCADGTALTCIGNDFGFADVFARQIEAFGAEGDVLALFSTSGRSENLLRAARAARARGVRVVAFSGRGGGELAPLADVSLVVPDAEGSAHVQEAHQVLLHALLERVEAAFPPDPKPSSQP